MRLLKSRVYPVNVQTREIYIGNFHDMRQGYPTERDCFEEWHGTDVTGIYGRHLNPSNYQLITRSIFKKGVKSENRGSELKSPGD